MSIVKGLISGNAEYEIAKSLRFRANASAYLSRTFSTTGNQKTWTWSGWVKRGALGTRQFITMSGVNPNPSQVWQVEFNANDKLEFYNSTINFYRTSTRVFRDPAAPLHLVFCADTNNATAQNRFRCWINGEEITAWDVNSTISLGYDFAYNGAYLHGIGAYTYSPSNYLDGYLSEINFIDGQALGPESFGQVNTETGQWIPKKYTGSYGTNGFYLPFNDGTNPTELTKDRSGNSNNWTATNISLTAGSTYDWMEDTPTNNYAVLNPLANFGYANTIVSNGNLQVTSATAQTAFVAASLGLPTSGKIYIESQYTNAYSAGTIIFGILNGYSLNFQVYVQRGATNGIYNGAGTQLLNLTINAGDIVGFACDVDAGTVAIYVNNSLRYTMGGLALAGSPFAVTLSGTNIVVPNFGQRPFVYSPPAGFKALCTKKLQEPGVAAKNPKKHFDIALNTGANIKTASEALFQSNFLEWIKDRGAANNHQLIDIVRGTSAVLQSNTTTAETTYVAPSSSSVGWVWKAGGAPVANTAGSISSQVSANVDAGFSIVTYTGTGATATVGHGLGVAPKMVIVKSRNVTGDWPVYYNVPEAGLGLGVRYIYLDTPGASINDPGVWQGSQADSSKFYIGGGSYTAVNASGGQYVAYCFAEVPGFSKISSYTGNGSADGPFIYCGFRPRYVLIKRTDTAQSWYVRDSSRDPYNVGTQNLYTDLSNAETTEVGIDFTSNGFKPRGTSAGFNASGGTYIFMAIADQTLKYSNAR